MFLLKTSNLVKTYQTESIEVPVLKGLNFEILPGQMQIILGPSGSGKTTFLNMIGGMDRFNSGQIMINIKNKPLDISIFTSDELQFYRRYYLGFVFQFYNLIPILNALENVAMAAYLAKIPNAKKEALSILKKLGLEKRSKQYPGTLSGGEQQRVAIARAIVKKPLLILADEPTGNLDSGRAETIFDIFKEMSENSNATIIIVSHDYELAKKTNAITHYLQNGVLE